MFTIALLHYSLVIICYDIVIKKLIGKIRYYYFIFCLLLKRFFSNLLNVCENNFYCFDCIYSKTKKKSFENIVMATKFEFELDTIFFERCFWTKFLKNKQMWIKNKLRLRRCLYKNPLKITRQPWFICYWITGNLDLMS